LADGFVPSADDVFQVIAAGTMSGEFDSMSLNLDGGNFDVRYADNAVTLSNFSLVGPALQAGDADMNLQLDQLDLIKVLQAGKYLTGESATWGQGDWDKAPGGIPGHPPTGDKLFNNLDIVAALQNGLYRTGPYAAAGLPPTIPNLAEVPYAIVPEPTSIVLAMIALILVVASNPLREVMCMGSGPRYSYLNMNYEA
jgi:hypothetical protein